MLDKKVLLKKLHDLKSVIEKDEGYSYVLTWDKYGMGDTEEVYFDKDCLDLLVVADGLHRFFNAPKLGELIFDEKEAQDYIKSVWDAANKDPYLDFLIDNDDAGVFYVPCCEYEDYDPKYDQVDLCNCAAYLSRSDILSWIDDSIKEAEKLEESVLKVNVTKKILEGSDVRSVLLEEYIPDITQRYPEGMYEPPGFEDDFEVAEFEPTTMKDVIKTIESDDDFYRFIRVWKNNKMIGEFRKPAELKKFEKDFVRNWRWFDETIDIYLV